MAEEFDVIIIGSGAGGGTLAYRLAPTGKRILILERGGHVRREIENWDSREVFVRSRYKTMETWYDKDGKPFHPGQHYYVGGQTKFYGAILFRLREADFGEVRHHGGISPAWPLSYQDFAPYYDEAERLYLVHGERGEDPTEPPASGPYPYPAVSHEPRMQKLHDDLERAGHQPFHLPVGVNLDEQNPEKSVCIRCTRLDGFPCLVEAKADADVCAIRPALEHPNVALLTKSQVVRLETDPGGRTVTGVVVDREGERETYRADVVVVSCGAINSAVLLLNSANDQHPNGLANSSDVVGRHYMAHINSAVIAVSKEPNPTRFQKTLGLNDYYWGGDDGFDFPLGHIQMLGKTDGQMLKAGAPPFTPGFALDFVARHAVDFWLTTEDLPRPSNRVTLDRAGNIHVHYTNVNLEPHRRLLAKLKGLLPRLDMYPHLFPNQIIRDERIPIAGVAHQCGTVRFGSDPATSALDVSCKAHDLDNLYVVDTSFFPSASAVNPALTAMANALRVGDHLIERLGADAARQPTEEPVAV
jgi:choline dehydrogenase-like flavoprotein